MSRLQSEFARLYLVRPQHGMEADVPSAPLVDASGSVRAMVLELTGPPEWEVLSKVWQGVQAELELPAPAIAVSGIDGLQLWFSVADPIPVARAHAFLDGLRQRFLADVAAKRLRLLPALDASAQRPDLHAALVPAQQADSGNWSAFLAPDLVPIFADSPWLDIPPNEEGQATLLRGIVVMKQSVFEAACAMLRTLPQADVSKAAATGMATAVVHAEEPVARNQAKFAFTGADPAQFLRQVMCDENLALSSRIEAAKALLQHANPLRGKQGD